MNAGDSIVGGMGRDNVHYPLLMVSLSMVPLGLAIYGTERAKNPFEYWFVLVFEYGLFAWLFITAFSN